MARKGAEFENPLYTLFTMPKVGIAQSEPITRRILRVNPCFCELTGYSESELLTMAVDQLNHPEDRQRDRQRHEVFVAGTGDQVIDKRIFRKDGTTIWVQVIRAVERDAEGRPVRCLGIFYDITARKENEEQLRVYQERLALAAQTSGFGIYDHDFANDVSNWSPELYVMMGVRQGEPISLASFEPLIHSADREFVMRAVQAAHNPEGTGEFAEQFRVIRQDTGEERWIYSRSRTFFREVQERKQAVRNTGVAIDITEHKRAEAALRAAERRLRAFLENSAVIAWLKDEAGRYVYVSPNCERRFNIQPKGWENKTDAYAWSKSTDEFRRNDRAVLDSPEGHLEVVERTFNANGEPSYWMNHKFVLHEYGRRLVGGLGVDITQRKLAEDALVEADRRKDEFLAVLAHELRNTLAPILNDMEFLRTVEYKKPGSDAAWQNIERQLGQMTRLINDLLDVSRIVQGKIELNRERLRCSEILDTALESARPLIQAAEHTVSVDNDPNIWVDGDRARLVQVFNNLLVNAAKFTPRAGNISLRARRANAQVLVTVRDTGVGISKGAHKRIFEPFQQEDVSGRAKGGLGVGLTLVQRLVQIHGGQVSVFSEGPDKGSEFTVVLPAVDQVAAEQVESTSPPSGEATEVQPVRVLVVDDNKEGADSLKRYLDLHGHIVRVAYDGEEGLRQFREFFPKVVLLDLELPGIDGFAVARRIRAAAGRTPLLVALSGYGGKLDKLRTQEAGFDAHMAKPINPRRIAALLVEVAEPAPGRISAALL